MDDVGWRPRPSMGTQQELGQSLLAIEQQFPDDHRATPAISPPAALPPASAATTGHQDTTVRYSELEGEVADNSAQMLSNRGGGGGGVREDGSFHGKRQPGSTTSVGQILKELAVGDPIGLAGERWKLTRAVVHLEDSWCGRISPCPPALEKERVRKFFVLRWHVRRMEILLIHGLMALALVETPEWCVDNGRCFWSCYPDFSRNWHLDRLRSQMIEAVMLLVLAAIAILDVVRVDYLVSLSKVVLVNVLYTLQYDSTDSIPYRAVDAVATSTDLTKVCSSIS